MAFDPSYKIPLEIDPQIYRNTRFTAVQCFNSGFSEYCDSHRIENAISGLVDIMRYISDPIAWRYGTFLSKGEESSIGTPPLSIGVEIGFESSIEKRLRTSVA